MLKLKAIKKDYVTPGMTVHALKGIDLTFRDNEFVSILGPSGCGKTTLLNIIGGLDHYTGGELFIDGVSTKNYGDRDWDTYRNHRIGFVFQSYNLIPHQTILENVELALSISGVGKAERVKRSKEALDKVGLKDLYNKKPNQLSGGQCQRVAIARALVKDPEILLADEPTGALDTQTSVQIMEIIKEISSECLVIMVTHNPELAEKYSTRIIRLLDGEVLSDTMPYFETEKVDLDYVKAMPEEYYSAITTYNGIEVKNSFYTDFKLSGYDESKRISLAAAEQIYVSMLEKTEYNGYSQYISMLTESFMQAPDNEDFILSQYDIIYGDKIATKANEIMIVVNSDYELSDLLLAELGYYSQDEFVNLLFKAVGDDNYDSNLDKGRFSYEELLGKTFTWYSNDVIFNETNKLSPLVAINPFTYNAYEGEDWEGETLTVTAILKQKDGLSYGSMESGFYYTSAFTEKFLNRNAESEIVKYLSDKGKESFTSMNYNMQNIGITYSYEFNLNGDNYSEIGFVGSSGVNGLIASMTGQNAKTYTLSKRELGGEVLPNTIKIYPTDFTYKDNVTDYISAWNGKDDLAVDCRVITAEERSEIIYTDNLSIVIGLVNNMIDVVTAALIAFTALSLVVSTVMIAIITYVSVIERIKEIGVIRSLGGRKSDVSRLFNAETCIIGGVSGLIGIGVTYLISAILNLIVSKAFGIATIATLTPFNALLMVLISVGLTMIAGLIPASLAAKKDPVVALRIE